MLEKRQTKKSTPATEWEMKERKKQQLNAIHIIKWRNKNKNECVTSNDIYLVNAV